MRKRLWRRSLWLILILLTLSLSGSGCKFTITVIDRSGCGGTVTPTEGTPGSCKDIEVTIEPGSCERYAVLVDGDALPECCPDNIYTGETEWKGTVRIIVVFYGKEESESGEVLEPIDIQPCDDGGGSDGIVIIEGSIPTDEVITLPPPPDPPDPPSCKPLGIACASPSECCTGLCFIVCFCIPNGLTCGSNNECCSPGICPSTTCCLPTGATPCFSNLECCSNNCFNFECFP